MPFEIDALPSWNLKKGEASFLLDGEACVLPYHLLPVFDAQAWTAEMIKREFPSLAQVKTGRVGNTPRSFESWYDNVTTCYLYALDDRTVFLNRATGSSVIGAIANNTPFAANLTKDTLISLVEAEGLKPTGRKILWEQTSRPVALFLSERHDYHWLRLDRMSEHSRELVWSHKTREEAPCIVTGNDGNHLRDPRLISFPHKSERPYSFVSFFNIPADLSIPDHVVKEWRRKNGESVILCHEVTGQKENAPECPRLVIPQTPHLRRALAPPHQ